MTRLPFLLAGLCLGATLLVTGSAAAQPTATPTPVLPPLNHFTCYDTHGPPAQIFGVTLDDLLGPGVVDLKKLVRFCAPSDKNDEDPTAPSDPDQLGAFTLKQTSPRFTKVSGVQVMNQFGPQTMDVVKPDRLLVPTASSTVGPALLPATFGVDHFKCYKVAKAKLRVFNITLRDQFDSMTVDIKKPTRLCVHADKNGEGIPDLTQYLLCYQVAIAKGTPRPVVPPLLYTVDQFGPDAYEIQKPRELCVPSEVTLP